MLDTLQPFNAFCRAHLTTTPITTHARSIEHCRSQLTTIPYRRTSQKKPSEELFKDFKAKHPEVGQGQSSNLPSGAAPPQEPATTIAESLDVPASSRYDPTQPQPVSTPWPADNNGRAHASFICAHASSRAHDRSHAPSRSRPLTNCSLNSAADNHLTDLKDADSTPRGSNEPWNFGSSGLSTLR